MPFYLLLPLACALVYTIGSLLFKRAYFEGAGPIESFHWANILATPFFMPLFFITPGNLPPADWWRPILTSALTCPAGRWSDSLAQAVVSVQRHPAQLEWSPVSRYQLFPADEQRILHPRFLDL